jgi:hypothetical protein
MCQLQAAWSSREGPVTAEKVESGLVLLKFGSEAITVADGVEFVLDGARFAILKDRTGIWRLRSIWDTVPQGRAMSYASFHDRNISAIQPLEGVYRLADRAESNQRFWSFKHFQ